MSVVMPCLNEADTVATCVGKACRAIAQMGIAAEVIVADNGSKDGSQALAEAAGARVIAVSAKGYGNALMAGIEAARGKYVIMGDADDSYDFLEIPKFVEKLRAGHDLVQGCRLPWGGGTVLPGAMPFLHRWWGNPMFTLLAKWWFGSPVNDIYCGLRGFTKEFYHGLHQRCTGMEFATEMLIKGSLMRANIAEVPITLHPDGRKAHAPHLKTFRDGWRTLRFFLLCSPRWLFFLPGLALMLAGLVGYALALPGVSIGGAHLDAHTLLFASLFIQCGYQAAFLATFSKEFATNAGILPAPATAPRRTWPFSLEGSLILGSLANVAGFCLLGWAIYTWWKTGFGPLDYAHTMRRVIPGATLCVLGFQTIASSFFLSVLALQRK